MRDDNFWVTFIGTFAVIVALLVSVAAYRDSHVHDKDALVCRMNHGQPVLTYYAEFACVQEIKP